MLTNMGKIIRLLILIMMLAASSQSQKTKKDIEIDNTFKLLAEGDQNIELSEKYKQVTLVVGNTGSGKSTFVQWIAGDNDKLISKAVDGGIAEYIIEDGNRIGSSMNSKTTFPELVVHKNNNNAFYDCPGFSDTRSLSFDIASTYFIKKITDHVNSVKIFLTVSHPSVRRGVDRHGFVKLLRHTTELIKDVEKFKNSLAIVVTKVDNIWGEEGLVADELVIEAIAYFLIDLRKELEAKSIGEEITEKRILGNAIKVINILLTKKFFGYTRIVIFRRPNKPGPLSKITILQSGKRRVEQALYKELKFTDINHNDFGYTISDKSKNDINILVERINDKIWDEVSEISDKVKNYHVSLMKRINGLIDSFIKRNDNIRINEAEAYATASQLDLYFRVVSGLLKDNRNITNINILTNKINSISLLGIADTKVNVENVSVQLNYFSFMQVVSDRNLHVEPWWNIFEKTKQYLDVSKRDMQRSIFNCAENIKGVISSEAESIGKSIEEHYRNKIELQEIEQTLADLREGFIALSNLVKAANSVRNVPEFISKINANIINTKLLTTSKIKNEVSRISLHGEFLQYLKILNNGELNTSSVAWFQPFVNIKRVLQNSELWYTFLNNLFARFSEYDIQKYRTNYNVVYIYDWGESNKPQGIMINKNNFKPFLEKIEKYSLLGYSDVKNLAVTDFQLKGLNHVLGLTLRESPKTSCTEPGKWTITGDNIKFSDFLAPNLQIADLCNNRQALNTLNIFSSNSIFVDRDFQAVGSELQINIIAPKWYVLGNRQINLDGAPGASHESNKANDGRLPGARGDDGLPGLPGGAGGNFLGIGLQFVAGKSLTITAHGGRGGPGQHGGAGIRGSDGEPAQASDGYERKLVDTRQFVTIPYEYFEKKYIYYGKRGGDGGNGGNGGAGGIGGNGGRIKVWRLDGNSDSPAMKSVQGSVGFGGNGGVGGEGGVGGTDVEVWRCGEYYIILGGYDMPCSRTTQLPASQKGNTGSHGETGLIVNGRKQPNQAKNYAIVADVVANYKSYLKGSLSDIFKKRSLNSFVKIIESNSFK